MRVAIMDAEPTKFLSFKWLFLRKIHKKVMTLSNINNMIFSDEYILPKFLEHTRWLFLNLFLSGELACHQK